MKRCKTCGKDADADYASDYCSRECEPFEHDSVQLAADETVTPDTEPVHDGTLEWWRECFPQWKGKP